MATKKRVLEDFRITAIAAVDRPAQEHALATIRKSADEVPQPVGKAKKLRDLKITELSLVDRPANVDAVVSIHKRDEPAPINLGNPAAQRTALEALERLINKAASSTHSPTLDEVLAKSAPTPRNVALDELEALVSKRMDSLGCGSVEAWDHFARADPDLYARAVGGN